MRTFRSRKLKRQINFIGKFFSLADFVLSGSSDLLEKNWCRGGSTILIAISCNQIFSWFYYREHPCNPSCSRISGIAVMANGRLYGCAQSFLPRRSGTRDLISPGPC